MSEGSADDLGAGVSVRRAWLYRAEKFQLNIASISIIPGFGALTSEWHNRRRAARHTPVPA